MSAWYELSGTARLRRCPEVESILEELRDLRREEFKVVLADAGDGSIEVTFRGGSEFTDAGADELDGLLASLGRHAVEPAAFTGLFDDELSVVPLDPADWSAPSPCGVPVLGLVR